MEPISDSDFERLADVVAARLRELGGASSIGVLKSPAQMAIDRLANAVARRFVELTERPPSAEAITAPGEDNRAKTPEGRQVAADDDIVATARRMLAELDPLSREEVPIEQIEI
jgi:hypothetical protein